MAGRGREMTLPAWMTKEGGEQLAAPAPQAPGGLNGELLVQRCEIPAGYPLATQGWIQGAPKFLDLSG